MVSVIIPNYNHASFLKQRINSILNQTWQNFEIIILDDCSTDNSKEIIETYRDNSKVKAIIYNINNSGNTFKQWERGIEVAGGDWIWIAESDDWCEPIFLETLIEGINTHTSIAIAQSLVVSDNEKILWNSMADYFTQDLNGLDFIKSKMLLDNFGIPNASMCIFKKENYYNVSKEFTTYKFCGDWLFWIFIAIQGEVFISAKVLNYFRKHDKDVSGAAYKNGLSYTEFFKLLDTLKKRFIINTDKKKELLLEKFKLFLRDKRIDKKVKQDIGKQFYGLIGKKIYSSILRYRTKTLLKKYF